MIRPRKTDDPVIRLDSDETFALFLAERHDRSELLTVVVGQVSREVHLTEPVRAVLWEALDYLTESELVSQLVANVVDRPSWPGYRQWCREHLATTGGS